ncbi:MAG: SUMF1/EgtB/PvdO family nonheme iron enzyme [Anaerolineales bacterium]
MFLVGVLLLATSCSGGATEVNETPPSSEAPPTPTRAPGESRVDARAVEQVWVPAGSFEMGTADPSNLDPPSWAARELTSEQPSHQVQLTSGFWMDKFEVTNAAYDLFVEADGYQDPVYWSPEGQGWLGRQGSRKLPLRCAAEEPAEFPRVCVTWYEAQAYANWRGGRLPTEAEWEYAARGPQSSIYPWGDEWDPTKANVVDSDRLTAVGSFPAGASWVGALDVSGNAMEWVGDWLDPDYYELGVSVDPKGPESGTIKIEKGGWWGSIPYVARAAYRHFEDPPDYQDHHIGFRVVTDGLRNQ